MSEFKFACPVCGQHITADSSTSGGQIPCPTCFQKIIVPQAPAAGDSKFILSASQVGKPRPPQASTGFGWEPLRKSGSRQSILAGMALLLMLGAAGAAVFIFRDKIFKPAGQNGIAGGQSSNQIAKIVPRTVYPIPTNFTWTLDLTNAFVPETVASGSIHGMGFYCERATLQGGNLTLRQGRTWPPDLGVTVVFFAQQGEDLSGKIVDIGAERVPPLPKVVLRWKDDRDQAQNRSLNSGYALRISFGEASNGRMSGKLYLCLPDETRSFVAGTFDAEIRKPPPPKPAGSKTAKVAKSGG
jgi:hypothetical protein